MEVRHYQSFSDLAKAIRKKHDLSQRALAKALRVSPGYIGQWELNLSQPSPEVVLRLCRTFNIPDIEFVQRLAFASRAPDWLRPSILRTEADDTPPSLTPIEKRILVSARRLPPAQLDKLAERLDGWVEAMLERDA
jgi:transcriptional regulator with XRE-family HTH domain